MTGIYISEVCLIGLFGINTAPGPIVLIALFLACTAIYHALMRHALKPLTIYLPDSYDDEDQLAMFSYSDNGSYDYAQAGVPPSEAPSAAPSKWCARKAALLGRLFDPGKFKSHEIVKGLVPWHPLPEYQAEEEEQAYFDSAVKSPVPRLWIVRDEMGISRQEVRDSSEVVHITDDYAAFDGKNKIVWEKDGTEAVNMPIYEKRIDY